MKEAIICPLPGVLKHYREHQLYGSNNDESRETFLKVAGITVLVCFFLALGGLIKAFSCGGWPTSLGLTGTTWGVLILILVILVPPLGSALGLIFAFGGRCAIPIPY